MPVRGRTGLPRNFSSKLDDYCFGGSFAAGLEDELDSPFAAEYASLRPRTNGKTLALPLQKPETASSSFWTSVANLAKSLIGIGMLTLPRAFADASSPLVATALLFCFGALAATSFFILGYCAHLTGTETLPRLWEATVGPGSVAVVEIIVLVDTSLSCIAFALLIGDYASRSVGGLFPGVPEFLRSRKVLVGMVTLWLLIPLCTKRRFSFLRFSSMAGLVCTLYVFLYLLADSVLFMMASGADTESITSIHIYPGGLLRSVAIYACAFMAHFNAPAFYADLKGASPSKFASLCGTAYAIAFLVYAVFGFFGFCRFGQSSPGNILTAYASSKPVLLMWLGMGFCVTASFPLVFAAHRDASLRLLGRLRGWQLDQDGSTSYAITVALVVIMAGFGAYLEDVSVVVSLCGAMSGACLALVFPGAVMLKLDLGKEKTAVFKRIATAFIVLGVAIGLLSSWAILSLAAIAKPQLQPRA